MLAQLHCICTTEAGTAVLQQPIKEPETHSCKDLMMLESEQTGTIQNFQTSINNLEPQWKNHQNLGLLHGKITDHSSEANFLFFITNPQSCQLFSQCHQIQKDLTGSVLLTVHEYIWIPWYSVFFLSVVNKDKENKKEKKRCIHSKLQYSTLQQYI